MSRATGEIYTYDGTEVGGFVYCGTACVARAKVYPSWRIAWDAYCKAEDNHATCECESQTYWVPVVFYTTYGSGTYWRGKFCATCNAITENWTPSDDTCQDRMCLKYGCKHWPAHGKPEFPLKMEVQA